MRGMLWCNDSCGWNSVVILYTVGCLDCAGLLPPALAACDASVLLCSFSQVLVHCSPEFSQTCCIDIQGLCLIPITALSFSLSLSVWLPPSETRSLFPYPVQEKWMLKFVQSYSITTILFYFLLFYSNHLYLHCCSCCGNR